MACLVLGIKSNVMCFDIGESLKFSGSGESRNNRLTKPRGYESIPASQSILHLPTNLFYHYSPRRDTLLYVEHKVRSPSLLNEINAFRYEWLALSDGQIWGKWQLRLKPVPTCLISLANSSIYDWYTLHRRDDDVAGCPED